jgi:hypothetical protein
VLNATIPERGDWERFAGRIMFGRRRGRSGQEAGPGRHQQRATTTSLRWTGGNATRGEPGRRTRQLHCERRPRGNGAMRRHVAYPLSVTDTPVAGRGWRQRPNAQLLPLKRSRWRELTLSMRWSGLLMRTVRRRLHMTTPRRRQTHWVMTLRLRATKTLPPRRVRRRTLTAARPTNSGNRIDHAPRCGQPECVTFTRPKATVDIQLSDIPLSICGRLRSRVVPTGRVVPTHRGAIIH